MSDLDISEEFVDTLYEMSEGDLKIFDRYEVGQKLALDAIVEELYSKRQIQKIPGTKIVLTPPEKEVLDNKKSLL